MNLTDLLPAEVLAKYRQLGWEFSTETWINKKQERQFALTYKSPRMIKPEISYLETLGESVLLDEEAWCVARRFMDDSPIFTGLLRDKMLTLFRKNKKINPDDVEIELNFNIKPKICI